MGADFTFAGFPSFCMTEEEYEILFKTLENDITKEQWDEFTDWFGEEEATPESVMDCIETACSIDTRETSSILIHNDEGKAYELNVTGGMSWGDPPTEAYEILNRAGFFEQIYRICIKFAIESYSQVKNFD